jgi:hypothetical protein
MAKKPAKKPVAEYKAPVKAEAPGKPVMYIGIGKSFTCRCGRTYSKGMTYEHNNQRYCSRTCVKADM